MLIEIANVGMLALKSNLRADDTASATA